MAKTKSYLQTKPEQLSLFELLAPEDKNYSNTIELYDFVPKYHWGRTERIGDQFLNTLVRDFECRGKRYQVTIDPARIEDKDGTFRDYYPSKREELVEEALRKLSTEGQGVYLDDAAGVRFTLHQLKKELARTGHTYSTDQIKDSLMVCAKTNLTITGDDGKAVLVSTIFETVGMRTKEDWEETGDTTTAFVRFNPLVTKSIDGLMFRQYNYERSMLFKSTISRQLTKRMSHHYIQASLTNPYAILLSTIIRDFGITKYERLVNNLREVEKALEEMKSARVVLSYKAEKEIDSKNRNKLIDAKIIITPDIAFTDEILRANKRKKLHGSFDSTIKE